MRRAMHAVLLMALVVSLTPTTGQAEDFAHPRFREWWTTTDAVVAQGEVYRAWVWGPEARGGGRQEPYAEAPGGQRLVQYFDKGRMELTHPDGPLTSGLLASQLLTGMVQVGDSRFEARPAPELSIVGDPDDIIAPTYVTFGRVLARPPQDFNTPIVEVVSRDGSIAIEGTYARYDARADMLIPETGHRVANVFRAYFEGSPLPASGEVQAAPFSPWHAVTGLPISEAYWTRARVGSIVRDVLVQAFERRVLSYTPSNPEGFKVEMGNIGLHYLRWLESGVQRPPTAPEIACPRVAPPAVRRDRLERLTLIETGLHDVGGRRFMTGTVRNDGDTTSAASVILEQVDSSGRVIRRVSGFTDRDIWPFGQLASFRVELPSDASTQGWRVIPRRNSRATGGMAGGFAIERLEGEVGGQGIGQARGQLTYAGDTPFIVPVVVRVHALDDCGNVVALGVAPISGGPIQPGSVTGFSTLLLHAEGATRLRAVVEARVGTALHIADDALRVYHGALYPAPVAPIVAAQGCCEYMRAYTRPDGTALRSIFQIRRDE